MGGGQVDLGEIRGRKEGKYGQNTLYDSVRFFKELRKFRKAFVEEQRGVLMGMDGRVLDKAS